MEKKNPQEGQLRDHPLRARHLQNPEVREGQLQAIGACQSGRDRPRLGGDRLPTTDARNRSPQSGAHRGRGIRDLWHHS